MWDIRLWCTLVNVTLLTQNNFFLTQGSILPCPTENVQLPIGACYNPHFPFAMSHRPLPASEEENTIRTILVWVEGTILVSGLCLIKTSTA